MDAIEALLTRRSTRSFLANPVEREKLDIIVDAGRKAASGMNTQGWHFSVITNRDVIRKLGVFVQENDTSICYDAPVFIIVSYEDSPYAAFDTSCALQNMMVASHALGLGSVWINRINRNDEKAYMLSDYGVPENHRAYGCLAVGYPADGPKDKELREGTVSYID